MLQALLHKPVAKQQRQETKQDKGTQQTNKSVGKLGQLLIDLFLMCIKGAERFLKNLHHRLEKPL